jgi:tellurium resistance protein TerZ
MTSINLTKGSSINLSKVAKDSSTALTNLTLGVGWDVASAKPSGNFLGRLFGGSASDSSDSIDLDASAILFDRNKKAVGSVYFRNLSAPGVKHTGDNLTGDGDGDDEQIRVDLNRLSPEVAHIVFTVSSFRGQTFENVSNAFCRIVNESSPANRKGDEMARVNLSAKGQHTAIILAKLSKNDQGEFTFTSIAEMTNGRIVSDLESQARNLI